MDSGRLTECAAADAGDSNYEYATASVRCQVFLFMLLENSPRIRHASVSRAACPGTATG